MTWHLGEWDALREKEEPTCPACGLEATQSNRRDLDEHTHELTAVCKLGHIWTTKWFASERSA